MDKRVRETLVRKKSLLVSVLGAIILVTRFQVFLRYKTIEVGTYQIRDDRLTLEIYVKRRDSSEWRETRFKTLNRAKAYFEKKTLLENTLGEKLVWWDDV